MINYKLLTPGPLTTSETVKREMLVDHCTWDDDYKRITQKIRAKLLELAHVSEAAYTAVLMQGSGTFGVEAVISSVVGKKDKILVCTNGEYGKRIGEICSYHKINMVLYEEKYNRIISSEKVLEILRTDPSITHIAMVHSETTTGILNDIEAVGHVCRDMGKVFIVDAMSSFGGIEIDMKDCGIDYLISSANKCIQGVPGFSFVIAAKAELIASAGNARSLSLDLYDQWRGMDKDGKWRFTSPTHVVLAFAKALEELKEEGGVPVRQRRYEENNRILIEGMKTLGIRSYIDREYQSPIITTFYYPEGSFEFNEMYAFIKERGYAIYPGKLTDADTFRIGNIGEIYSEDMTALISIISKYLEEKKCQ